MGLHTYPLLLNCPLKLGRGSRSAYCTAAVELPVEDFAAGGPIHIPAAVEFPTDDEVGDWVQDSEARGTTTYIPR